MTTRHFQVAIVVLSACGGGNTSLQRENDALRARVVVLEAQVETLRRRVRAVSRQPQPVPESVELPGQAPEPSNGVLTVALAADGTTYVNGNLVDDAEFARIAREAEPETRAVIAADRAAPYSRVVQIMDVLRDNGIQNFALAVDSN